MAKATNPEIPVIVATRRRIDERGRVTFPPEILEAADLAPKQGVEVFVWEGEIRIRKATT